MGSRWTRPGNWPRESDGFLERVLYTGMWWNCYTVRRGSSDTEYSDISLFLLGSSFQGLWRGRRFREAPT